MKQQTSLLAAAVLALTTAACGDVAGPGDLDLKAAAPNTTVSGSFTISSPGSTVITYRTTPKAANGTCLPGGVFVNQAGNNQGANHTQCTEVTVTPGATVVVTLSTVANYVQASSGNLQLNFTACGYVEDEAGDWVQDCDSKAYVHYKKSSNSHEGSGALLAEGDDGSQWVIRLSQLGGPGTGGLDNATRTVSGLLAEKVGSSETYGAASFSW